MRMFGVLINGSEFAPLKALGILYDNEERLITWLNTGL